MAGDFGPAADSLMSPMIPYYIIAGALIFLVCLGGFFLGVWFWRSRERSLLAALGQEKQTLLETARREADAIIREARLAANELALKLRSETEQRLG
jgi:hypothetical protein